MRAPLSIVIPTLNAEQELPDTLAHLIEGLSCGLIREVIVSDGGSSDATVQVAEGAGALVVTAPAGRGGQLRCGADAANGDWFLFLHADTHLSSGWANAVEEAMQTGTPGYFALCFRATGVKPTMVASWANLRSRILNLPYGDQGLLISRKDYNASGGYDAIPLMEDVALVRRLDKLKQIGATAQTSADRYIASGWWRRGARNLWTLARYFMGANPERLAQAYRKR